MKKSKIFIILVLIFSSIVACEQNEAYYLDKPIASTQKYEDKITDVTEMSLRQMYGNRLRKHLIR